MKKRKYQDAMDDIDRKLLPGLHHTEWSDVGESSDHTKYGVGMAKIKQGEKKIHKLLVV